MAERKGRHGRLMGVVILAALLVPACALVNRVSGVTEARELQKTGEQAQAKILSIWDTGMTVNDDPVVGFLLEVYPEGRPAFQAKTKLRISRLDIPRIQPGTIVPVRFDPNDPRRVALDIYEFK
jgi:hypothetical protein